MVCYLMPIVMVSLGANVDKDQERRNSHGARKREEEEKNKKKERGEEGWPAQNPVGPAPQSDRPVGARSTGPRTGPPGHRPGLTGPKPDLTEMTHQTA